MEWRKLSANEVLAALKTAAQQAQAEAWKLSKDDALFLKSIKIQP